MSDYQDRVVKEKDELAEKINKLNLFTGSPQFQSVEVRQQVLLRTQLDVMNEYLRILEERIKLFQDDGFGDTKLGAPACPVGEPCESCQ